MEHLKGRIEEAHEAEAVTEKRGRRRQRRLEDQGRKVRRRIGRRVQIRS